MEFTQLIHERRSVRSYEKTPVPREDLITILTQAQQAPSWKNQQTSRCYVAYTAQQLEQLREHALPSFNQNSSDGAVLTVTTFVKNVVGFNGETPANEAGNFWGAYDLGLHDAYLCLAATNAGYDTLIMGIRDADAIRAQMQIPENEQIMSVIALGKGTKKPGARSSKAFEDVVKFF